MKVTLRGRHDVADVSAPRLANEYFVVQGIVPEKYFVVQSSTGVVLCSTE